MNDICNDELVVTASESQTCSAIIQGQQTVQSDENEYDYHETTAVKDDDNKELIDDDNLPWKEPADKRYGQTDDKFSLFTVDPNNRFWKSTLRECVKENILLVQVGHLIYTPTLITCLTKTTILR